MLVYQIILGRSEILQILDKGLHKCRYRGYTAGCLMTPAMKGGKLEPLSAYFFLWKTKWGAVIQHGTVVNTQLVEGRRAASERRGTCR